MEGRSAAILPIDIFSRNGGKGSRSGVTSATAGTRGIRLCKRHGDASPGARLQDQGLGVWERAGMNVPLSYVGAGRPPIGRVLSFLLSVHQC